MTDHATIDHTGIPGVGAPADILDIPTAETDASLVLAPDGAGGVEFRAEAGGGSGAAALPLDAAAAAGVGSGDLFAGTSLDGGWSSLQSTAVTTVDRTVASFLVMRNTGNTGGLDRGLQRAFTPAGDFIAYCKVNGTTQNANYQWAGVFAGAADPSDGGSGNRIESFVVYNGGAIHWKFSKLAAGSETNIFDVTAPIGVPYAPVWLAVRRVGSTLSAGISFDGVIFFWSATTTTIAFTVATCGLFMTEASSGNDIQSIFNYIATQ